MEWNNFSGPSRVDDSRRQQRHSLLLWRQLSEPRSELSYRSHHHLGAGHVDPDNRKFLLYQHVFRHVPVTDAGEWNRELDVKPSGLHRVRHRHMERDQAVDPDIALLVNTG